jgi:hypothetical protein
MEHLLTVEKFMGTIEDLAGEVAMLREDRKAEFFRCLSINLEQQANKDAEINKDQLAANLYRAVNSVNLAYEEFSKARLDYERPVCVLNYLGTVEQLADDIGYLRYDKTAEFIQLLAKKVEPQQQTAGNALDTACFFMTKAWKICEKYM